MDFLLPFSNKRRLHRACIPLFRKKQGLTALVKPSFSRKAGSNRPGETLFFAKSKVTPPWWNPLFRENQDHTTLMKQSFSRKAESNHPGETIFFAKSKVEPPWWNNLFHEKQGRTRLMFVHFLPKDSFTRVISPRLWCKRLMPLPVLPLNIQKGREHQDRMQDDRDIRCYTPPNRTWWVKS